MRYKKLSMLLRGLVGKLNNADDTCMWCRVVMPLRSLDFSPLLQVNQRSRRHSHVLPHCHCVNVASIVKELPTPKHGVLCRKPITQLGTQLEALGANLLYLPSCVQYKNRLCPYVFWLVS